MYSITYLSLTITGFPIRLFRKGFGLTVCTKRDLISEYMYHKVFLYFINNKTYFILWIFLVHYYQSNNLPL